MPELRSLFVLGVDYRLTVITRKPRTDEAVASAASVDRHEPTNDRFFDPTRRRPTL